MTDDPTSLDRIVKALEDPTRCLIGDPREGKYTVSFVVSDETNGTRTEGALRALGLTPQVNHRRLPQGETRPAYIVLYGYADQRRLFDLLDGRLTGGRRDDLERLVKARGPIPQEFVDRMRELRAQGLTPAQIAERINAAGLVDGMGGVAWNERKVRRALRG